MTTSALQPVRNWGVNDWAAQAYTLNELEERSGVAARNIRFYTGRDMLPPPRREGRIAMYGAEHLVRLELIRELQAHGFTLAAITSYLAKVPTDGSPDAIRLHRTLLAPWMSDRPETLERAELSERAGRPLSEDDLEVLAAIGILEPTADETFEVSPTLLSLGVQMLDFGLPLRAAQRAQASIERHARALAEELTDIFREDVWPAYKATGVPAADVGDSVNSFRPLTVQSFVAAYERSVDENKRAAAERHLRRPRPARSSDR